MSWQYVLLGVPTNLEEFIDNAKKRREEEIRIIVEVERFKHEHQKYTEAYDVKISLSFLDPKNKLEVKNFFCVYDEEFRGRVLEEKEELSNLLTKEGLKPVFTLTETFPYLYEEIPEFNLGDYALFHLKNGDEKIKELLKKTSKETKHLPTVGLEIGYKGSLTKYTEEEFNRIARVVFNKIPETYSKHNKSEIRSMPTNPYAFKWLMENLKHYLPKQTGTIQVSVGNVNDKRMPWIFLTLYFMHASCGLEIESATKKDMMGFPGAYVGVSVNKKGQTILRGQTNYLTFHSSSIEETTNACLTASKLHAISEESFEQYYTTLKAKLGMTEEITDILENEWPRRSHEYAAYQMPKEFIVESIKQVKKKWNIKEFKEKYLVKREDIDNLKELNNLIKNLVEKYTSDSLDFIYLTNLEKLLD